MAIPGMTRYRFLTASAFHLAECYPDIRNQTHQKLKHLLPTLLQEPIALKEDSNTLQIRYKCPLIDCAIWVAMNKGRGGPETELQRHVKTHNKVLENDFPSVTPQWTQLVGVGRGIGGKGHTENGSNHYFTFPDTFRSPIESTNEPGFLTIDHTAPSTDTWAASLGWDAYIDQLTPSFGSREKAVEKLRDLVALPSARHVSAAVGLVKILEHGLLISNKLNMSYLEDAAIWVSLADSSFSAHFAHGGCVNVSVLCGQVYSDFKSGKSHSSHSLSMHNTIATENHLLPLKALSSGQSTTRSGSALI
jgi:hypothetical protein